MANKDTIPWIPKTVLKGLNQDAFAVMLEAFGREIGSKAPRTDRVYPAISNIGQSSRL